MLRRPKLHSRPWLLLGMIVLLRGVSVAETHFLEAESFHPSGDGWKAVSTPEIRKASRATTLWGADGPVDAVATKMVTIQQAGKFRIWVRWMQVAAWRGPFRVSVSVSGHEVSAKDFDLEVQTGVADWDFAWQSFDSELPAGDVQLTLTKHEQKNCVGYVRQVDCLLLTNDLELKPDNISFGPQTFLRVTLGNGFERPVYLHLFADHYRDPWYGHHSIGNAGLRNEMTIPADEMLNNGEQSPWNNISHLVYQDSGVALDVSLRHSYHEKAPRLLAKLEFGRPRTSKVDAIEVIKTFDIEARPNGAVVIVPPNLNSPAHIVNLKRDRDFANETGRLADAFVWPKIGKRSSRIPFLVSASIGGYELPVEAAVEAREQRTLENFGFNEDYKRTLQGLWMMKNNSYCSPDVDGMRDRVKVSSQATRIESVHRGLITFRQTTASEIETSLPLDANDWVKIYYN